MLEYLAKKADSDVYEAGIFSEIYFSLRFYSYIVVLKKSTQFTINKYTVLLFFFLP